VRSAVSLAVQVRARWPLPLGPAAAVLGWHRVDLEGRGLAEWPKPVSPERFARQMDLLNEHRQHFPVTHLDEVGSFLASGGHGSRCVVLTFDDAWADNHANALGPLSEHQLPAALYVPSRLLGKPGYMTRSQLLEMVSGGVTIGAHSRTHPDLRACPPQVLEGEVRGSKEDLEDLLGKPVTSFAYPTGLTDARVQAAVAAAGFRSAVTTRPGWWRPETKPLGIPRSFVENFSDATFLAAMAGGLNVLGLLDTAKSVIPGSGGP
jgi:peptidoglycan/xylan/chitin deacetylase (PgdA/CDA1 family)